MGKKTITINDISEITGLSSATISRAITGNGYVSEKSRLRILEAQKKLNYFPKKNGIANNSDKTRLIMLTFPDNENPFWFEFIRGVQSVCLANEYFPLLSFCDKHELSEINLINSISKLDLDGVIIVTLDVSSQLNKAIQRLPMAKVLCSFYNKDSISEEINFDYISVDTRKGTFLATNHLIQQGFKSIGYLGLSRKTLTGNERYLGYDNAMRNSNIPIDTFWVRLGDDEKCEQTGYEAIYSFYEASRMPQAVCTANDRTALGVHKACRELGIKIPDQLGIIGMDNIDVTDRLSPSISSIDISPNDLGRNSANLLFNRILLKDGLYQNITLEPKLVIKDSTKKNLENN